MTTAMEDRRSPAFTRGDRMRKSRKLAGLSQTEMGEQLAGFNGGRPVKHSTIAAWEEERNQPRKQMEVMAEWATITNVSLAWLLGLASGGDASLLYPHPREMGRSEAGIEDAWSLSDAA